MILIGLTRRTLRQFIETEEGTMRAQFFKLLHTAHIGVIFEVADIPVLKILFFLCHNAMFCNYGCKGKQIICNSSHSFPPFYNIKVKTIISWYPGLLQPLYEGASKVKKIDEQAERERRAEDMERAAKSEAKFFARQSVQRPSARQ